MLQAGENVAGLSLLGLEGSGQSLPLKLDSLALLVFFETDCPTCRLLLPYLNRLHAAGPAGIVFGISQDGAAATRQMGRELELEFPLFVDADLSASRTFDPPTVPALFLVQDGKVVLSETGFQKETLNRLAASVAAITGRTPVVIAEPYDGAPAQKPGCMSRHLYSSGLPEDSPTPQPSLDLSVRGQPAGRIELSDDVDPYEYCFEHFQDPLPVIPPTLQRVERMLTAAGLPADTIVARVPPCYGVATVEKIAANAVMAGCVPEMMPVLIPLVRAACDERFNVHGLQSTTHIAAPLVIVNGPVRRRLGFVSGAGVFSNTARANSTLGRALQLILLNLGGARPGEIDMSTLGHPGRFSFCIAENEEESPWDPFHVERGFQKEDSTVTLFGAEPPRSLSEHNARTAEELLRTFTYTLATVWTYRACVGQEALVLFGGEHARTLKKSGISKADTRQFLFENTGVPVEELQPGSEGGQWMSAYQEVRIRGKTCYRKFERPEQIHLLVAGGTAGKFSAVLGGWLTGPRGSQMVTYPVG